MSTLIQGITKLLQPADDSESKATAEALDRAMQDAIEKRAAENAAAKGRDNTLKPRVSTMNTRSSTVIFGRRG